MGNDDSFTGQNELILQLLYLYDVDLENITDMDTYRLGPYSIPWTQLDLAEERFSAMVEKEYWTSVFKPSHSKAPERVTIFFAVEKFPKRSDIPKSISTKGYSHDDCKLCFGLAGDNKDPQVFFVIHPNGWNPYQERFHAALGESDEEFGLLVRGVKSGKEVPSGRYGFGIRNLFTAENRRILQLLDLHDVVLENITDMDTDRLGPYSIRWEQLDLAAEKSSSGMVEKEYWTSVFKPSHSEAPERLAIFFAVEKFPKRSDIPKSISTEGYSHDDCKLCFGISGDGDYSQVFFVIHPNGWNPLQERFDAALRKTNEEFGLLLRGVKSGTGVVTAGPPASLKATLVRGTDYFRYIG